MSHPFSARDANTEFGVAPLSEAEMQAVIRDLLQQNAEMAKTLPLLESQLQRLQQTLCLVLRSLPARSNTETPGHRMIVS
jgi:Tfp pilus assembly protein PilO